MPTTTTVSAASSKPLLGAAGARGNMAHALRNLKPDSTFISSDFGDVKSRIIYGLAPNGDRVWAALPLTGADRSIKVLRAPMHSPTGEVRKATADELAALRAGLKSFDARFGSPTGQQLKARGAPVPLTGKSIASQGEIQKYLRTHVNPKRTPESFLPALRKQYPGASDAALMPYAELTADGWNAAHMKYFEAPQFEAAQKDIAEWQKAMKRFGVS